MTKEAVDVGFGPSVGGIRDGRGRLRLERVGSAYASRGEILSYVLQVPPGRACSLDWIEQWTAPQHYEKHPGNPIYGPGQSGAWDSWTNGVSIVPFDGGARYRMYYSGTDGEGIGFAEASADDPTCWREHLASPVLVPRADNWEGNRLNQPRVVKVTEAHWRMYYTGWAYDGPGTTWALGLAESYDGGTTWGRVQDAPIHPRGDPDSYDGGGACVPMVIRVGDEWWMWYTAAQVNRAGHQNIHLCLATSDDGVRWRKHPANPVLGDDFSDGAPRSVTSRCFVRYDDGVFRMWYSFAKPDYRILYAESLDGIEWERSPVAPVLGTSEAPAWDDVMVEYPEVQIVDGVCRLWFCGNGFGSVGYAEARPHSGVDISFRTGRTAIPDESWGGWQPATRRHTISAEGYLQVRAQLWTEEPLVSPALNEAWLRCSGVRAGNASESA